MASSFQAELIEPALYGTLNVLGSCAKNPTVKRVVLTSSVAAVAYNGRPRTSDVIIDETLFSDPESCKENKVRICVTANHVLLLFSFYMYMEAQPWAGKTQATSSPTGSTNNGQ